MGSTGHNLQLQHRGDHWLGTFHAMASPCELLSEEPERGRALQLLELAAREAWRIEAKFSRYRDNSIISRINALNGTTLAVDDETARLLDYAERCYALSDGLFDVTSGVLRKVWHFDGSDRLPEDASVTALLDTIGWRKVTWQSPAITLPAGMELDLGGIGKEYAVDRVAQLLMQHSDRPLLVNFGGDLYASGPRSDGTPWVVAMDDPGASGRRQLGQLHLRQGGMATSGDGRRYLLKDGQRHSHILNPRSGWPVPDAPHSVTVVAENCMSAGMLATFAMLQGAGAQQFLEQQQVPFWLV